MFTETKNLFRVFIGFRVCVAGEASTGPARENDYEGRQLIL